MVCKVKEFFRLLWCAITRKDPVIGQYHWCPFHGDKDVLVKVIRVDYQPIEGKVYVCNECPECREGETWHDDREVDFCWCQK